MGVSRQRSQIGVWVGSDDGGVAFLPGTRTRQRATPWVTRFNSGPRKACTTPPLAPRARARFGHQSLCNKRRRTPLRNHRQSWACDDAACFGIIVASATH